MPANQSGRPQRPWPTRALTSALVFALALAPVRLAHAQTLPDLGDAAQAILSPQQERRIGEQALREMRSSGAYLNDPEVNAYLNELGNRLVAASSEARQEFEFFAVNDNGINAFALPGGFVGVHTGLLLLAQSESELAAVLAHEIAHVTQHHIARMLAGQQRSMLLSLAALAGALLAARSGNSQATQAAIASAQGLSIQSQLDFTREHEREADRIGFQILEKSGFEVQAMPVLLERLQRAIRFADGNAPTYLRTHPITAERIADTQARAQGKPYRQVSDSADFHYVRALLRSYQGSAREAVAYFDGALAERKFNNEAATRYGLVASLLRAEEFERGQKELARLESLTTRHPMVEAMAGQMLLQSKQPDKAISRYQSALAAFPGHRQLVYDYPDALLRAGKVTEAVRFVESQLARRADDGILHQWAAKSYAAAGRRLKQHHHQGEFYAWQGNLRGAIDQLDLAIKAGDGDFYQISAVESRLRTMRKELAEQQKSVASAR